MPDPTASNLMLFFGRLHPLLVHLPIGFLATLAVLELANRIRHFSHAAQARSVVLALTVIASIVSVTCGLMLASAGGYDPSLLFWHKWMGIALAIACLLTAVSFWGKRHRLYVGSLMITLLLLGPASHFGGSMTHGKDYLITYAPQWMRAIFGNAHRTIAEKPKITDAQQAIVFRDIVQPVLAQNRASCHNESKLKGQLRVDSFENLSKGGATGAAFVAGKSKESLLVQRMLLPPDDPKHMPPSGMAQPSDDQVTLLRWWIDSSASSDKTVAQLEPSMKLADAISNALGIVPASEALAPTSVAQVRPMVIELQSSLGIVIDTTAAEQPWLLVNASVAKSFGDAELARLAPIAKNVVALNLSRTQVTDAGVVTIAQMSNIQRVRLEQTAVTDAGLVHLSKLRKLEYVNLYGTSVTDAGLKSLEGLPALRHVYLWRTKVTPEAASAFADAMVDHVKVQRWRDQIAMLESQIDGAAVEVFQGVSPATMPATAPTTAASTMPTTAPTTTATKLVNDICPVSGKPVVAENFIDFKGQRIGFCCDHCPKLFEMEPEKYLAKLQLKK